MENIKIAELEKNFEWGSVIKTHVIGEYQIIEYTCPDGLWFHPYVNYIDTNNNYESLDEAITDAIIYKYDGANSQANKFLWRMIR